MTISNPYWDAVKDRATPSSYPWENGALEIERFDLERLRDGPFEPFVLREQLVKTYSWTVTDPASVEFVAQHAPPEGLVDPLAGTGYWAYVLAQVGVSVVCYDLRPPDVANNPWAASGPTWVPVIPLDGAEAAAVHPDRALLLSWPPYSEPVGERVLREYTGHTVIFMGESEGGCTGDKRMFDRLDNEWTDVVDHRPVQWWGLHDWITVYQRRTTWAGPADADAPRQIDL